MKNDEIMNWKNSLVFKIVGTTLSVYFLVTLVITGFQMYYEYVNTRERVFNEVKIASESIRSSLTEAMWNIDTEVINSIVKGLVKNPSVVGAIAYDTESKEVSRYSSFNSEDELNASVSDQITNPFNLENPYSFQYNLVKDGKKAGLFIAFTSGEIIWNSIVGGFTLIVFNKTIEIIVLVIVLTILCLRILKPMKVLMSSVNELSKGNLDIMVEHKSKDEFGHLSNSFNRMIIQLSSILKTITQVGGNVATGSEELRSTSGLISEGASSQAVSVEETSVAISEMAAAIGDNSQRAKETEHKAELVADESRKCLEAVQRTTDSMKDISERITIVDEITKKIDLLALNASVEAARAGEHGKGFAVVASEVSKLADMSKQSSSEILRAASESKELAETTSQMLAKLLPEIEGTKDLVVSISSTSKEQDTGASQVNQSMQELDKIVQNNASAAEKMSGMSESLQEQANKLQVSINYFRFKDEQSIDNQMVHHMIEAPKKE